MSKILSIVGLIFGGYLGHLLAMNTFLSSKGFAIGKGISKGKINHFWDQLSSFNLGSAFNKLGSVSGGDLTIYLLCLIGLAVAGYFGALKASKKFL